MNILLIKTLFLLFALRMGLSASQTENTGVDVADREYSDASAKLRVRRYQEYTTTYYWAPGTGGIFFLLICGCTALCRMCNRQKNRNDGLIVAQQPGTFQEANPDRRLPGYFEHHNPAHIPVGVSNFNPGFIPEPHTSNGKPNYDTHAEQAQMDPVAGVPPSYDELAFNTTTSGDENKRPLDTQLPAAEASGWQEGNTSSTVEIHISSNVNEPQIKEESFPDLSRSIETDESQNEVMTSFQTFDETATDSDTAQLAENMV